jgi:hypothetical protein
MSVVYSFRCILHHRLSFVGLIIIGLPLVIASPLAALTLSSWPSSTTLSDTLMRCAAQVFRESQPFSEVAIKRPISAALPGTGNSSVFR